MTVPFGSPSAIPELLLTNR